MMNHGSHLLVLSARKNIRVTAPAPASHEVSVPKCLYPLITDHCDDEDAHANGSISLHRLFRAIYDYRPHPDPRGNLVRVALHGLFRVNSGYALCRILPLTRRSWRI